MIEGPGEKESVLTEEEVCLFDNFCFAGGQNLLRLDFELKRIIRS